MFSIVENLLQDIFRLQMATHLEIQSISRQIAKLERKQHLPVADEDDLVTELLPLKMTDENENFDKIIGENAIAASQFVSFLHNGFARYKFYLKYK